MTSSVESALSGTNLELKARIADLERVEVVARQIGAEFQGSEHQVDQYFAAPGGRIKLRTSSLDGAYLIVYARPDGTGPEVSTFHRLQVEEPEALARVLSLALGAGPRIVKTRRVLWWRDVRIHLDEVEGLGTFIEFEARLDRIGDRAEAERRVTALEEALAIDPADLIDRSYREMLA